MKTIMVDMDNVITDTTFFSILEKYIGKKLDFNNMGYYIQDILGDKKEDFFNKFKYMNIYKNAILLPDCYEILKELNKNYKIYICTDYIWKEIVSYAGLNLKNKYDYLYEKLDFINPRNYIFTADKSIINTDIKIDDKLENLKNAKIKLLFTAYHNKKISNEELNQNNIIRTNNWKEIGDLLLTIEKTQKVLSKKHQDKRMSF